MSSSQLFHSNNSHYHDECLGFCPGVKGELLPSVGYSLDPIVVLLTYLAKVQDEDGEHVLGEVGTGRLMKK